MKKQEIEKRMDFEIWEPPQPFFQNNMNYSEKKQNFSDSYQNIKKLYVRRMMVSKSGFLARAGKAKKTGK